ncbi:unnamed protein product [Brachionus calyciflorus]|uniref:Uncharacterized protein n=1 Tax=Brachionus calyciflorus TaxID=104777 RepID=A0A813M7G2_9BILA|nr:unnamed protein product [Brachionus calyciflorus]
MRGCKRSLLQSYLDELIRRFNNQVHSDRVACYNLILVSLAKFYKPGTLMENFDRIYLSINGDDNEDAIVHLVDDTDNDDDSEDEDPNDELDKDVNDCDKINAQSDDDDATIAKSQSKQSGTLSSDSEPD